MLPLIVLAAVALAPTRAVQAQASEAEGDGTAGVSESDDALARRYFELGSVAYAEGRYEEALDAFERAYELSGRGGLLYNIALTYDRMRDDERALAAYEAFLASSAADGRDNRTELEERVARLREALARRDRAEPSQAELPDAELLDAEPEEVPASEMPASASDSEPGALPWVLVIAGGAVAAAGGVFVGLAAADRAAVEGVNEPTPFEDVRDAADRYEPLLYSGIAALAAGGAAALAGALWIALGGSAAEDATAVALGPGTLTLRGAF